MRWLTFILLWSWCASCSPSQPPTATPETTPAVAARAIPPPHPPLPLHTLGVTDLSVFNYPYREGREAFESARTAAKDQRWGVVEAQCRAALSLTPEHTDARRLLATALSELGKPALAADQLNMALADDWLKWGPGLANGKRDAALRESPQWTALATLNEDYRARVSETAKRGLWMVGRRTAYQLPSVERGEHRDTTRAEVFVWDEYEARFHRISHTRESVLGWSRLSGGDAVFVTSRRLTPGKSHWRLGAVTLWRLDGESLTPKGTAIAFEGVVDRGAIHEDDAGQLVLTMWSDKEEGATTASSFVADFSTGKLTPRSVATEPQPGDLLFAHEHSELSPEPLALSCTGPRCTRPDGAAVKLPPGTLVATTRSPDGAWLVARVVSPKTDAQSEMDACAETNSTLLLVALEGAARVREVHTGVNTFHRVRWEGAERFVFEADQNVIMRFDRTKTLPSQVVRARSGLALNGLGAQGGPCDPRIVRELAELKGKWIEVSETIQFETDKAVLLPESLRILDDVADILTEHPELELVQVQGHTDRHASHAYNVRLSVARAEAVKDDLIVRGGIASERIITHGFGKTRMLDPSPTIEADAKNRRVNFRVVKTRRSKKRRGKPPAG